MQKKWKLTMGKPDVCMPSYEMENSVEPTIEIGRCCCWSTVFVFVGAGSCRSSTNCHECIGKAQCAWCSKEVIWVYYIVLTALFHQKSTLGHVHCKIVISIFSKNEWKIEVEFNFLTPHSHNDMLMTELEIMALWLPGKIWFDNTQSSVKHLLL